MGSGECRKCLGYSESHLSHLSPRPRVAVEQYFSHRGCFDQRVIPGSAGLYCPVKIIMDTATCPGPLESPGPKLAANADKMCFKRGEKSGEQRVINRNCFIMFWRLTLNGRSLFFCVLTIVRNLTGPNYSCFTLPQVFRK